MVKVLVLDGVRNITNNENYIRAFGTYTISSIYIIFHKQRKLLELQSKFLNYPETYKTIGDAIRRCQIIKKETQKKDRE